MHPAVNGSRSKDIVTTGAYLEILRSDGTHICDSENETYGVEDIGLSAAVQASNRVEAFVPAWRLGS